MRLQRGYSCVVAWLLAATVFFHALPAESDTVQYFYDGLGRLTQVINGSVITNYAYDEVGNILSVSNGSLADAPSVTNVSQNTLLVGVKTPVEFTGLNLFSASGVTSLNGTITVNSMAVTPTKVSALLTATSPGADTLKLSFRDNNQTVYRADMTAVAASLTMSPLVTSAPPNSTATAVISLNPPLDTPLTVGLRTDNTAIATVPGSVTIPVGGSATVQVNTGAIGTASITTLNGVVCGYAVSESPIDGSEVSSYPLSVMIAPSVQQPPATVNTSLPVSVTITPSASTVAPSVTASFALSATITLTASPVGQSVTTSASVSTQVAPSPSTVNPSVTVSPQISVSNSP